MKQAAVHLRKWSRGGLLLCSEIGGEQNTADEAQTGKQKGHPESKIGRDGMKLYLYLREAASGKFKSI